MRITERSEEIAHVLLESGVEIYLQENGEGGLLVMCSKSILIQPRGGNSIAVVPQSTTLLAR